MQRIQLRTRGVVVGYVELMPPEEHQPDDVVGYVELGDVWRTIAEPMRDITRITGAGLRLLERLDVAAKRSGRGRGEDDGG